MNETLDERACATLAKGVAALLLARLTSGLLAPFAVDDPHPTDDLRQVESLYDRYATVVFSLAFRIVRDRGLAEEILQEVFVRAWQRREDARPDRGTLLSWLIEVTRTVALAAARERGAGTASDESLDAGDVETDAWTHEARREVAAALAALPPEQRRAIELAYFEGLPVGKIAQTLAVPENVVRTWLRQVTEAIGRSRGTLRRP